VCVYLIEGSQQSCKLVGVMAVKSFSTQCQNMHLGHGKMGISYNISNVELSNVSVVKDLGITVVLFYVIPNQTKPVRCFMLLLPM